MSTKMMNEQLFSRNALTTCIYIFLNFHALSTNIILQIECLPSWSNSNFPALSFVPGVVPLRHRCLQVSGGVSPGPDGLHDHLQYAQIRSRETQRCQEAHTGKQFGVRAHFPGKSVRREDFKLNLRTFKFPNLEIFSYWDVIPPCRKEEIVCLSRAAAA